MIKKQIEPLVKDIDDLFINELVVEPDEIEGMTIEDLD